MMGFVLLVCGLVLLYVLGKIGLRMQKKEVSAHDAFVEKLRSTYQFNPTKIYKELLALDAEKKLLAVVQNGELEIIPLSEIAVFEKQTDLDPFSILAERKGSIRIRTVKLKEFKVDFGSNVEILPNDWVESIRILSGVVNYGAAYVKSEHGKS